MIALLTLLVWTLLVRGRSPQTENKPSTTCSVNDAFALKTEPKHNHKKTKPSTAISNTVNPGNQTHKAYEIWIVAFVARSVIWSLFVDMKCKLHMTNYCIFCLSNYVAVIQESTLHCRSWSVWRPYWATWIQVYNLRIILKVYWELSLMIWSLTWYKNWRK